MTETNLRPFMDKEPAQTYSAPWCRELLILTLISCGLLLALSIVNLLSIGTASNPFACWIALSLPCLAVVTALFSVRRYQLTPGELTIDRLFWTTRIPLADLQSAEVFPSAMRSCIRLFGIGGMFSFTGLYWSKPLGRFSAYVTDFRKTVVLRLADRTIVLSPGNPEQFVAEALCAGSASLK